MYQVINILQNVKINHYISTRMATSKRLRVPNADKNVEQLEILIVGKSVKQNNQFGEAKTSYPGQSLPKVQLHKQNK